MDYKRNDKYPNDCKLNQDTVTAIEEVQQIIKNKAGEHFNGSTAEFLNSIIN